MQLIIPPLPIPSLIGTFKTLGDLGPAYEVVDALRLAADGDWIMRIRILTTGEEVEYRYSCVLDDPLAT